MTELHWMLQRYSDNGNSTQGLFFQKTESVPLWISHALEDEFRKDKVAGETRIDAGIRELKIAKFTKTVEQKAHGLFNGNYLVYSGGKYQKTSLIGPYVVDKVINADAFILDTLTPLTVTHRKNYNVAPFGLWFKHHIEITDLPRHKAVYLHAGNSEQHTDACVLLGDTIHNHTIEKDKMERSTQACKRFYDKCYPHLLSGQRAFIEVRDEIMLK